jgi:acid phosphatase (class A)
LILSEIAPERQNEIFARGQAYGQSRVVCNVHWQSDVVAGRSTGAAAVARLHANPEFLAALAAAKEEFTALRATSQKPARDCDAEAKALGEVPQGMPWPANK